MRQALASPLEGRGMSLHGYLRVLRQFAVAIVVPLPLLGESELDGGPRGIDTNGLALYQAVRIADLDDLPQ